MRFAGVRRVLLKLGLAVVWFLGLPLTVPFVHSFMHARWIIQDGAPQYRWGVLVAVLWCVVLWLMWPDVGQLRSAKLRSTASVTRHPRRSSREEGIQSDLGRGFLAKAT